MNVEAGIQPTTAPRANLVTNEQPIGFSGVPAFKWPAQSAAAALTVPILFVISNFYIIFYVELCYLFDLNQFRYVLSQEFAHL